MLPFLQPKKITSILMATRKPDGSIEQKGEVDEVDHGLMSAAEDIISAVHAKDATALSAALKAAFEVCDEDEPEEGSLENG